MKLVLIISMVLLGACSSLNSLNKNTHNKIVLKSGKAKSLVWNDSISFSRDSWFDGATLKYDLLHTKLEKDSPFVNWIGKAERDQFNNCDSYYIILVYSQTSQSASKAEFMSNFDLVGLKRISIPIFESNLRNHNFNDFWKLHRHSLYGLCKTKDLSDVEVSVPNFSTIKVLQ